MYLQEQLAALKEYQWYMENLRFKAYNSNTFSMLPFQRGALLLILAVRHLIHDMATKYNQPLLLTGWLSQDDLERFYGIVRGVGGGFNLHPTELEFFQRKEQQLIAHKTFIFPQSYIFVQIFDF